MFVMWCVCLVGVIVWFVWLCVCLVCLPFGLLVRLACLFVCVFVFGFDRLVCSCVCVCLFDFGIDRLVCLIDCLSVCRLV